MLTAAIPQLTPITMLEIVPTRLGKLRWLMAIKMGTPVKMK